jgi:hypothetical protein
MTRAVLTAALLAALPLNSRAEEAVVQLTVRPMAAPKPVLKYQLLPELRELNPGNAAHCYLRCFMVERDFFYAKQSVADRARYQTMPLAELPAAALSQYGGAALRQADWAARLDTLDWQALPQIQNRGIDVLPPELGPLQVLAGALQVRFRAEVAGRCFDDAIRTAKTMLALARHLGEHPLEVAHLIGLWVAHLSLDTLEEMVQQPGCPNLYWALTDLPSPLVDLRKGVQGDRTLVAGELRRLREDVPMTEAEMEAFLSRLSSAQSFLREQSGRAPRNLRRESQARLRASVKDSDRVLAARGRLVEAGCARELVKTFPASQVILLDEKREFEVRRDERMKLLALPLWQIDLPAADLARDQVEDGLLADLLPHIVKLRRTQGRLEQQIALLRHVEALRLYAAEHDGNAPAELSLIPVPLPIDPATGMPFDYAVEGASAHVRGRSIRGERKDLEYDVYYRVTLEK